MGKPGDIRLAFDDVAEIYDSVRPSYPVDLFDALLTMLPTDPMVVEVGPGTGQATRDLLARGASVLAIEIGPSMATTLQRNLSSDRLRVSVGDFETETVMMGEPEQVRLLDDIESLVTQEFGGAVVRPLVVTLTTAVRR